MRLPIWASRYNDIERLQHAWQTEYKKRALGGAVALSGFHYQFLVTLHDTLRAWLKRAAFERSRPKVLMECLSDILDTSSNDIVLVTQVKRTNRSGSIQDALTELWLIYELALETTPQLVPYLHFRILSKNSELKDFERALSHWQPGTQQPTSLDLKVFRQAVKVELFSDPENEILALLANELRATEPTAYVHRWLGKLLSAASREGASAFEDAAQSIWDDLQSIENSSRATPPGIYVWASQDKAPEHTPEGQVLTGERPQVHHLREGFFAGRPAVYDPIVAEVQEWNAELISNQDKQLRLPVFWIGGRSGSGKSIALMHVLASLYESGIGPVLWLGNKTELLRQAISWTLKLRDEGRQVIIGIDDPYSPNTQSNDIVWKEALAVLESVRQTGDASALPLIVCCGPSEQAERMQRDLPGEVNVNLRKLPEEDVEDVFQLRHWYTQRTKKSPPRIGDENILLVQLFFQWETGQDLTQFAYRFRGRIREMDRLGRLEDLIASMLCVNRLYVGYPTAAVGKRLPPDLRDIFDRLREEHHITQSVGDQGTGFWLAHAHLSNLIYESWYPLHSSRAVRADHLRRVITECLECGNSPGEKMAPLWAISNALFDSPSRNPLVGRLDPETIAELLPAVYASRVQDPGAQLTLSELPVWIRLHASTSGKVLSPDPVDEALRQLKVENLEEKGLRLTCHKLLQYYESFSDEQQSKIVESIHGLLVQAPHWYEWAPVADDAYRRTRDRRFMKPILDWVNEHPRSKWAERLFFFLFSDNSADPQVLSAAEDLLPRVGGELGWGEVAIQLMKASEPEVPTPVLEWAANNCKQRGACFVLSQLLRKGRKLARGWAFEWCARWHAERTANYVLEPLLTLLGAHEKLRDWCMRWIEADHQNVDTGFIVEKLVKTFPSDAEVQALGLHWLENNDPRHRSWQFVWHALYNTSPYQILTIVNGQTNLQLSESPSDGSQLGRDEAAPGVNPKLPEMMSNEPKAWYYLALGFGKAKRYDEEVAALLRATELDPQFPEAWQALGAVYSQLGQQELALRATVKLTELRPDDPQAWYYLSIAHGRDGQYENQIAALTKATELDPQFAKALWALRNAYARLGRHELALEAELRLVGVKPENPESWYDLATILGRNKDYELQVEALTKAVELQPDFADAWRMLGAAYNRLGQNESALKAVLKLTELRPDDPEAWYYLSIAHSKADQPEEKLAALTRATELDPQHAEAWQALGSTYSQLGQHELALAANLKAAELRPDNPEIWLALGAVYNQLRQAELAVAAAKRLTELRPDDAQAWYYLAISHSRADHTEEKLAALTRATELDPQHAEAWQALGATYNQLGQHELALAANLKTIELRPDDPEAWYYLSIAHSKADQPEEKLAALTRATELDPQHAEAWQALGSTYSQLGQHELALAANLKAAELRPDNPEIWLALGAVYNQLRQAELAVAAAKRLTELRPDDAQAWYYLAISHSRADHTEEKLAALTRATELDPQHAEAWQALGATYNQLGMPDLALAANQRLTELRPDNARNWYYLAIAYSKAGRDDEQVPALLKAIELDPQFADAWQTLCGVYAQRHQYDLWLEARIKVVELKPDDPIAKQKLSYALAVVGSLERPNLEPEDFKTEDSKKFYSLAKSYVLSGQHDEAVDAFKEAIKASTDEIKARSGLLQSLVHEAIIAFYNGSYERAIILLRIVAAIDQSIAEVWRLLSSSYHRAGREEEALNAAKYLCTLTPTDAYAWYKLGKRYAKMGQVHSAAEAFNQALRLNEELKPALRELNKLQSK